jgi:hypothetical protein
LTGSSAAFELPGNGTAGAGGLTAPRVDELRSGLVIISPFVVSAPATVLPKS